MKRNMKTTHRIYFSNAQDLGQISTQSIDLVATSPPYPMIAMWDEMFSGMKPAIAEALKADDGPHAFECMHRELDAVWQEAYRVLKPGGIACINIGDATRTIGNHFSLFPNHARILSAMLAVGFTALPLILWRKQTNAPNKFMGSGMMPPGAYVTLEHEYILIFRKGGKRLFSTPPEKQNRRESAYFWEERNAWFSDVWADIKGTTQDLFEPDVRRRSAAFPFELPYRLISMFSVKGDLVLDPFLGTGTTTFAAMACGRNSIGYEADPAFRDIIENASRSTPAIANQRIARRFSDHEAFIRKRSQAQKPCKYHNRHYGIPVVTAQENDLLLDAVAAVDTLADDTYTVTYTTTKADCAAPDGENAAVDKSQGSSVSQKKFRKERLFKS